MISLQRKELKLERQLNNSIQDTKVQVAPNNMIQSNVRQFLFRVQSRKINVI